MFSHKSQIPDNTSDPVNLGYGYALAQKRIGETILNAATNEFINFSIENDQKMLLDTSGTLTIGHNTTQYTDPNGIVVSVVQAVGIDDIDSNELAAAFASGDSNFNGQYAVGTYIDDDDLVELTKQEINL